jgi:tetratricopeptide (TPR) repeat protein
MGNVYYSMKDYRTAYKFYKSSLAVLDKIGGFDCAETAAIFNNLALTCLEQRFYSDALTYFQNCLQVQ